MQAKLRQCRRGQCHAADHRAAVEEEIEIAHRQRDRPVLLVTPQSRKAPAL
jgi:hypothetical protein